MSNPINLPTMEKAKDFNSKQSFFILPDAISEFPGLAEDRSSDAFYEAVLELQADLGLDTDGFYGKSTHAALIDEFGDGYDFIVHNGARIPIDPHGLFYIKDFTEDPSLDLHKYGNFSKRKEEIQFLTLHHGGLNPKHLAQVFSNTERKVSSHFGIGIDEHGDIFVAQYLDTKWKAWHAGGWNEGSIGIDICFQPEVKWNDHYKVEIVDNPSSSGPRKINKLPDDVVAALVQFISQLSLVHLDEEHPTYAPEVDSLYSKEQFLTQGIQVVGHHHKTANKWDCGYVWQRLLDSSRDMRDVS